MNRGLEVTHFGGRMLNRRHLIPDRMVPDPQATRQVQLLQAPAVLRHLFHRLIRDVGIDGQRQRPQVRALPGQVADGVVFEVAAGGEVDGAQPGAVVGQAAQRQAVHPLAVSQAQVLQVEAAQGHGHQGVTGEPGTTAHVHPLQMQVLADHGQQLLVRHPVGAALQGQALENFVVLQHGAKGLFGNRWPDLQTQQHKQRADCLSQSYITASAWS